MRSSPAHPPRRERRRQPGRPEQQLQRTLCDYFREAVRPGDAMLFAVANGEKRDETTAGMLVGIDPKTRDQLGDDESLMPYGQGVVPGVSDLILVTDGATTYVELKIPEIRDNMGRVVRARGTLNKQQRRFRSLMQRLHQDYRVIETIEAFDSLLREKGIKMRTHPLTLVAFHKPPPQRDEDFDEIIEIGGHVANAARGKGWDSA